MNTCDTCENWKPQNRILDPHGRATEKGGVSEESGQCLVNGPFPAVGAAGAWRTWPVTLASDGCPKWAAARVSVKTNVGIVHAPTPARKPDVKDSKK